MGTLYGVSTGPGDPTLMTVKAVQIIRQCRVIAAPHRPGTESLALRIAKGAVNLSGKLLLPVAVPMTEDAAAAAAQAEAAAELLCGFLRTEDAAFLCLGDLSLYASFRQVAEAVRRQGFPVESIPGVPSFCAAAACTGVPLAAGDTPVQILPYGCEGFRERLMLPGGTVVLKCGRHLPELCSLLAALGLAERAYAVENCGLPEERIYPLHEDVTASGYFTTVYIAPEEYGHVSL